MERMKTYGNSMTEMLLLFPGTVSSPMIELPIWLSDNGGARLMSSAPFADMRMNADVLTHVLSLQAANGPLCGPEAYFSGPLRAHLWWEHKFSQGFSTPYLKNGDSPRCLSASGGAGLRRGLIRHSLALGRLIASL